jgi:hypothetical protein
MVDPVRQNAAYPFTRKRPFNRWQKNGQDPMSPAIEVFEVLLKARLIALFSGARGASLASASAVGVIRPGAEEKHGREGNDHKGTHGNLRYATLPIKTLRPVGFAQRLKQPASGWQLRSGGNSPPRSRGC